MATQRVHPQAPREGVNQNLRLSAQGRAELIHRERPIEHYYNDSYNCTYGIGTLAHFGRCTQEELHRHVTPDQIAISMQQGIQHAERAIRTQVTRQHLTQEQFDALVSFVYNVGSGNAAGVLSDINAGRLGAAADRMMQFTSVTERDPNGRPPAGSQRSRDQTCLAWTSASQDARKRAFSRAPGECPTSKQMKTLVIWMLCSNAVWAHDLKQLLGTWKTVKVVTASPIVGSDPDLDTLAGKYLYVGPKTVRVGRHSCIGPYKPIRESLAEFQEDYKLSQADVRDLNLPDPVSGYRADCIDIFLPKPGIMIFNLEGFFYRAVRVSNITQPEAEKSHNNHAETQPQHSDH